MFLLVVGPINTGRGVKPPEPLRKMVQTFFTKYPIFIHFRPYISTDKKIVLNH